MSTLTSIKKEFPILTRRINGKPLVYLDNASTTHKPRAVLDAIQKFYTTSNANIHRGIHTLSEEATEAYEEARETVATFIHARVPDEIVFTKNCTESINLVARSWGAMHIKQGDQILVSALEHHANLVPWQELAREKGAILSIIPLTESYQIDQKAYERLLTKRTKLVCVTSSSNVLGVHPDIKMMAKKAHAVGARILVDGAQSVGHGVVNVQASACDFFTFSAHKMLGPTGVGMLYAKKDILDTMPPFLFGGDMVTHVEQYRAAYREVPWRFEAGTPNIADVVACTTAIRFIEKCGREIIETHDKMVWHAARQMLSGYSRVKMFGADEGHAGSVLSFAIDGVHPHDVATIFDSEGVAIRSGLHCAEPLIKRLGVDAVSRMSFYLYNTEEDIDIAERALKKVFRIFSLKGRA